MTTMSRSGGLVGCSYDRYVGEQENSTLTKMQQQFWSTKHAVFKKLGKKEDDCIVASDSELDSKLELFEAIQFTSFNLQKVIEQYQDKLLALSHEENALGRYLKANGKADKTRAGKMMTATGKAVGYSAQQRLAVRVPLVRLHQEVETFRHRAVADSLVTVEKMERSRTEYRGALLWMKNVSQELDPDTFKQLEKFRKVQGHVRKTKSRFDKLKLDCLQKIDLLAASRCNMFSHALATYQNTLLHFWDRTSRGMKTVAESFRGYQHFEFSMLKELTEVGKNLAEETGGSEADAEFERDRLIFFEEFHDNEDDDEKDEKDNLPKSSSKSDSLQNLFQSLPRLPKEAKQEAKMSAASPQIPTTENDVALLDLGHDKNHLQNTGNEGTKVTTASVKPVFRGHNDLLTNNPEIDDTEKDYMALLEEILNSNPCGGADPVLSSSRRWDETLHQVDLQEFLPSQLLDLASTSGNLHPQPDVAQRSCAEVGPDVTKQTPSSTKPKSKSTSKKGRTNDMSAWFSLFADLDPLANPDAVGKKVADEDDRNC